MDAQAYLRKQGWRGAGHSLDHAGRGIKNPLLVSKKVDVLGVGLNKHTAVSDQWWLRAFDAGLKNFGTGKESALVAVQKHGINRGGLYTRFVKGESVPGTFELAPSSTSTKTVATISNDPRTTKRKRAASEDATRAFHASDGQANDSPRGEKSNGISPVEAHRNSSADRKSNVTRTRKVTPAKLAEYQRRAKEKNTSLETYMRRREEKFAAKHGWTAAKPG